MSAFFASRDVVEARLIMCSVCTNKKVVFGVEVCNLCGCVIAAKANLTQAECPAQKWKDIPKENEIPNNSIKLVD